MAMKVKSKMLQAARLKINILKEVNQFHYTARDNAELTPFVTG